MARQIAGTRARLEYMAFVAAKRTLVVAELAGSFDVVTTVKSGGVAAQADAVKMGIARALIEFNPELRKMLKAEGRLPNACDPRDLILRAVDFCRFEKQEFRLTDETLALAWTGYFGTPAA